jgi:hypothetical protein
MDMKNQWLAMEHYRMHTIEEWPEGPHKEAALAAIRSTLVSLSRSGADSTDCYVCQARRRARGPVEFPIPIRQANAA